MKDWFDNLDTRERTMVSIAGAFLIFAIVYLGAWMPLDRSVTRLSQSVSNQQDTLSELRRLRGRVSDPGKRSGSNNTGDQSLVVVVDNTLRERGLSGPHKRSSPTGSTSIRVEFEDVAFDELIRWLGELNGNHSMQTQSASISNRPAVGKVNSTLTLERTL